LVPSQGACADGRINSDDREKTWVWRTEESELWFDEGTVVNLRIEAEKWHDQAPKDPNVADTEGERKVPYAIEVGDCFDCSWGFLV
jgi:DNA-directed RNA polymerase subunit E'/Rpb7